MNWTYVAGIAMVIATLGAMWQRRWVPLALYALADLLFAYEVGRDNNGWNDLADLATLIVIVLPIYVIGTAIWLIMNYRDRYRK
ncbi:hypothetical protein [Cohnella yongneupensis]|uniref:Uncharacterized protein n=1 Tax=Cohnella yongneupensis TaxID=425006 RepID=A0ABW0QTU9_9BACL